MTFHSARDRGLRTSGATLLAIFALVCLGPALSAADDAPMRTEDVVRMLVRGVPAEEILAAIRTRQALFDVSPDMQEELRLAGVSEELIQAMADRMAELNPSPPPVEEPEGEELDATDPAPTLRVWLDPQPENGKPLTLRLKGSIDFRLREAWQLDPSAEGTPFEDLVLFLVCRTATHVPDHWRSRSPLGRDFISMPRHRMLVFLTATEEGPQVTEDGLLKLELPTSLEVDLPPDEIHDLSLGIALQAAGRYLRWTGDTWDELSVDPAGTEIRAEVRSGRDGQISELEVRFNRNPASPASE